MNPGNSGHRGYKMSKVTSIEPQGEIVAISLACGHIRRCYPYGGMTAEEYARHIQQGIRPFVIGETRIKCEEKHI